MALNDVYDLVIDNCQVYISNPGNFSELQTHVQMISPLRCLRLNMSKMMFFPKTQSVKKTFSSFLVKSKPIVLVAPVRKRGIIVDSSFPPHIQAIQSAVITTRYPESNKSYHFCYCWSVPRHHHFLFGLIRQPPIQSPFSALSPFFF